MKKNVNFLDQQRQTINEISEKKMNRESMKGMNKAKKVALTGKESNKFIDSLANKPDMPQMKDPTNGDHWFKTEEFKKEHKFMEQMQEQVGKDRKQIDINQLHGGLMKFNKWLKDQENDPINQTGVKELQYLM